MLLQYCSYFCRVFVFFFFKQKTAYEMRISDWSSDVCSSDLKSRGPTKRRSMHCPGTSDRRCASSGGGAKRLRRSFVWRVATMEARQRAACFRCPCHGARGRPSSSRAPGSAIASPPLARSHTNRSDERRVGERVCQDV